MAYRAIFEEGVVEFNSTKDKTLSIYQKGKEVEHLAVSEELLSSKDTGGNISQLGGYFSEIKYFVDCIENDEPPRMAEARSAKDSLEVVLMEKQSAEEGKTIEIE